MQEIHNAMQNFPNYFQKLVKMSLKMKDNNVIIA